MLLAVEFVARTPSPEALLSGGSGRGSASMIGSTLSRLGCVIIGHVYPVGSALAAAAPRARALVAAPVRDVCCAP